jgi:hypothetical protein
VLSYHISYRFSINNLTSVVDVMIIVNEHVYPHIMLTCNWSLTISKLNNWLYGRYCMFRHIPRKVIKLMKFFAIALVSINLKGLFHDALVTITLFQGTLMIAFLTFTRCLLFIKL